MNSKEHLLTCIIEEAAEIQQAATKALRFGLEDGYPGTDRTNADDLCKEINDLVAVVELAEESGIITKKHTLIDIEQKKARVKEWMEYAIETGALTQEQDNE